MIDGTPAELARRLREHGGRGWVVTPPGGEPAASADWLRPVAGFLAADERDFLGHEGVFLGVGPG